jgi:ADP-dependent NAD(P)H-hydrate dehydratase / NAD(P)H-hydrate epimerase
MSSPVPPGQPRRDLHAIRVTSASESAALDSATIAAGVPSRALMQRAGAAAAGEITRLFGHLLRAPVAIYAGPGNNGGDAWVVARSLAAAGVPVRVLPVGDTRTEDARAERALAEPLVERGSADGAALLVDGLLGTGSKGAPRGEIAEAIARINLGRAGGATVIALDVPSGLDSDTGEASHAVRADVTLTFGTLKRGLVVARHAAGRIIVLDIGLGCSGDDNAPALATERWVRSVIPAIHADAHKGTRKKLVIIGGRLGMVGAAVMAARAAMRSGIGMVRLLVAPESLPIVQGTAPHALARQWPSARADDIKDAVVDWADAVLVGPGLGDFPESRTLVERVLETWRGPVVVDADALNVFKGEAATLGDLLEGRPALLTPHVAEFSRLSGASVSDVQARRFDIGTALANVTRAAVLLKGVPTVVSSLAGERIVSATGTPALAAAGSGDLLAGIAGTLIAQLEDGLAAGACAAWVHGRAAELAGRRRHIRGVTLDHVEWAISRVWSSESSPTYYPVLAELPAVGVEQ